ncbi:hypothetical protein [Nostoc edaphicum]|nr:hypothetical protein [Nostoc edaphicum]
MKRSNHRIIAITSLRYRCVPCGNAKSERNDKYLVGHYHLTAMRL